MERMWLCVGIVRLLARPTAHSHPIHRHRHPILSYPTGSSPSSGPALKAFGGPPASNTLLGFSMVHSYVAALLTPGLGAKMRRG
ncbi:hypothetical protein GGR54DRAFT_607021 [Hypoxylon sp. NC1633]|nr:hypothetical protein GGR54DRAFT_607021 [Hypoxylon sp. NC1633]